MVKRVSSRTVKAVIQSNLVSKNQKLKKNIAMNKKCEEGHLPNFQVQVTKEKEDY